jgi:hypothetical protein
MGHSPTRIEIIYENGKYRAARRVEEVSREEGAVPAIPRAIGTGKE